MKEEYKNYYIYLENLRNSGITNMYGASVYLQQEFGLDKYAARNVVINWMQNYDEIATKYYREGEVR